jgi:hypothetical protein
MLQQQISQDFLTAYKAKRELEVSTLRMLKAALTNKLIEKKMAKEEILPDEEAIAVIKSEVKKRKDSAESYESGGRTDLADKEKSEISILEKYLPQQLSEDKVRELVTAVISEMGAIGSSDFGKAMGVVMAKSQGMADGQIVSKILKEELGKLA